MSKIKVVLLFVVFTFLQFSLFAQNSTNSPYTRYGYGELSDQTFGSQRGMGGIGLGLRSRDKINPSNPASFSNVDSLTFMFDLGVTGQVGWFTDGDAKARKINGNIDYVAMQFPLFKGMGMGVGFKPVSQVGYKYGNSEVIDPESKTTVAQIFNGTGGMSEVYGALSYNFFKRLSLGVDIGYLFGDIRHARTVQSSASESWTNNNTDTLRVSGVTFNLGFQYVQPIGKDQKLVVGGIYAPKLSVNGKLVEAESVIDLMNGTVVRYNSNVNYGLGFEMPESYGLGFTYNKNQKWTVGADFLYEKWADAQYYGKTDTLKNRSKINIGGEYIPDARSRNFFNRVRYRAGGYYSDSYVKVKGSSYNIYGATLGLGLPMNDGRSFINLAFDYSMVRPDSPSLIDEQHFKITLSYTFNELWFYKLKVQ